MNIYTFTLVLILLLLPRPDLCASPPDNTPAKTLQSIINEKSWDSAALNTFHDNSHITFRDHFAQCVSITIPPDPPPRRLPYKAQFPNYGETGIITFDITDNKLANLKIEQPLQPLYFMESFRQYPVQNLIIQAGDAIFRFIGGAFYQPLPHPFLLLFDGTWEFALRPSDPEEQHFLTRRFKTDQIFFPCRSGIFILPDKSFLEKLTPSPQPAALTDELTGLLQRYRERFCVPVPPFNDYWQIPPSAETALVFFNPRQKESYIYMFNPDASPDAQLAEIHSDTPLLSYNSYKGLKLRFGASPGLESLTLNLWVTPQTGFLSGTAQLHFASPSSWRTLRLHESLTPTGDLDAGSKKMNAFHKKSEWHFMGAESDTLSLFYRGAIPGSYELGEIFGLDKNTLENNDIDFFYYLSRRDHFYPNPGDDFFKSSITVNIPEQLNCLVSGEVVSQQTPSGAKRKMMEFHCNGSQGVSLICGDFREVTVLPSRIPLTVCCSGNFNYRPLVNEEETKTGWDFLTEKYGPPGTKRMNVLLGRGRIEGGLSNTGFVFVSVNPTRRIRNTAPTRKGEMLEPQPASPVTLRDEVPDFIIHELAHQWWGELIAPESYADVWISEGLAHFSTLWFLESRLPKARFSRMESRMKRWIRRFNEWAPIGFGSRIHVLADNYDAYQSIVYNKSAFLFFMLRDMLGEEDLLARLRGVLEKYRHKTISTAQFIGTFSGSDKVIADFLRQGVHTRTLPTFQFRAERLNEENQSHAVERRFKITLRQSGDIKTFPLKLRLAGAGAEEIKTFWVTEKNQEWILTAPPGTASVKPVEYFSLVKPE